MVIICNLILISKGDCSTPKSDRIRGPISWDVRSTSLNLPHKNDQLELRPLYNTLQFVGFLLSATVTFKADYCRGASWVDLKTCAITHIVNIGYIDIVWIILTRDVQRYIRKSEACTRTGWNVFKSWLREKGALMKIEIGVIARYVRTSAIWRTQLAMNRVLIILIIKYHCNRGEQ